MACSENKQTEDNSCSNGAPPLHFFQPKLSINTPGDAHEQEADAMADKVMRMPMPQTGNTFFKPALSIVQRKCAGCEQEDKKLHRKEHKDEQEEKKLHRKEHSGADVHGSHDLDSYVSSLSSSGQPLPESSRQFFEPRYGEDFSNVRVHTDSVAAKSARSINALAYTTGNNIVFNNGQYAPGSESGNRLMAHELTHVVQQGNIIMRQAAPALAEPVPDFEIPPMEPANDNAEADPLQVPQGPRYAPNPNDNSWNAMMARAQQAQSREQAIYRAETPVASLERGGSAPRFVTSGNQQQMMGQWGTATFIPKTFHVLDAIEFEVSQAQSEQRLEAIKDNYIPETNSNPNFAIELSLPFYIFPTEFDPGGIVRKKIYSAAVKKRIAQLPSLSSAHRLATATDAEREIAEMNRRAGRAYPICWSWLLRPPTQTDFIRTPSERDDTEAAQGRMLLNWRQFRDPSFQPSDFHIHHVNPLFLGGADDLVHNGTLIDKINHMRGHDVLHYQPQMLFPPAPLIPLTPDLYRHPPGIPYRLVGFKSEASELCG